jgi:hypothetical protein
VRTLPLILRQIEKGSEPPAQPFLSYVRRFQEFIWFLADKFLFIMKQILLME